MSEKSVTNEPSSSQTADQDGIDFVLKAGELQSGSGWFNPEPGTHKVQFLDDGTEDTREYDGEERRIAVFRVRVDGEELKWSVTQAATESSLWGQLVSLGAAWEGLAGREVTLIRQGTKQDTRYTVTEAADL